MSFIGNVGQGPGGAGRFGQTRGRIQGSPTNGVSYPSPFFDVANTFLPTTVKQLFKWCRYYFLTNPLINAAVFKLSEYPVTDIIIDHESSSVVKLWTEYFQDHLNYRAFQVETGLDYHVYGNLCTSLGFPFHKYLTCMRCKWKDLASKSRAHWVFTNYGFRLTCPACGNIGDAIPNDVYFKNASGIKPIRWNAEDIEITYNDITGEYTHFYTIPATVRNDVTIGRKDIVENVPQVFIQAMKEQKGIVFSKDNFFHMRRPTLATQDRGWGIPLLLPILKDTFYLQIMKKANEAVMLEHIVPLRILFPQAGSGSSDPYSSVSLVDWRDHVATEIARWRLDPCYIPILPLPVGNQTIGGDGKALMLTAEMSAQSDNILAGMGLTKDFLLGGSTYSGASVSMRAMENMFLGYITRQRQLARFMMRSVAGYLGWPEAHIRFKPFKMADDIQRKAYHFQLNAAGKISDTTLLADADFSQEEENEIMIRETDMRLEATKKQQLAMAQVQGEAQMIMMKFQAKAQQEMQQAMGAPLAQGEAGGPEAGQGGGPTQGMQSPLNQGQQIPTQAGPQGMQAGVNVDIRGMAQAQANLISNLPAPQQEMAMANLRSMSPELAAMVQSILGQQQQDQPGGPDTRMAPEQRPARRAGGV